jgi:uncharacterized membrane-anchored protein
MAKAVKKSATKTKKPAASKSAVPANAMDYSEHENTYELFLWLSKWTVIFCVVLLLAMAVIFYTSGGFVGGVLTFIILMVISYFAMESGSGR